MKLKSYTFIEVLISLIISSIVIFITYVFLTSLFNQYEKYKQSQQEQESFLLFRESLRKDFFYAKTIEINNDIVFLKNDEKLIFYRKTNNLSMIREEVLNTHKDTFKLKYKTNFHKNIIETKITLTIEFTSLEDKFNVVFYKDFGIINSINQRFWDENRSK